MSFNSDLKSHLRKKYKELFSEAFPEDIHEELIKLKIEYEMLVRKLKQENKPIPEKVLQNYESALEFNLESMTESLQSIIRLKVHA